MKEGPNWKNIRFFHEIIPREIYKLKEKEDITILGSGTIVQQLSNFGLIDEYSLVVVPIILGTGKPLFKKVKEVNLKLVETKTFTNGVVLSRYQPIQ